MQVTKEVFDRVIRCLETEVSKDRTALWNNRREISRLAAEQKRLKKNLNSSFEMLRYVCSRVTKK